MELTEDATTPTQSGGQAGNEAWPRKQVRQEGSTAEVAAVQREGGVGIDERVQASGKGDFSSGTSPAGDRCIEQRIDKVETGRRVQADPKGLPVRGGRATGSVRLRG